MDTDKIKEIAVETSNFIMAHLDDVWPAYWDIAGNPIRRKARAELRVKLQSLLAELIEDLEASKIQIKRP